MIFNYQNIYNIDVIYDTSVINLHSNNGVNEKQHYNQ